MLEISLNHIIPVTETHGNNIGCKNTTHKHTIKGNLEYPSYDEQKPYICKPLSIIITLAMPRPTRIKFILTTRAKKEHQISSSAKF